MSRGLQKNIKQIYLRYLDYPKQICYNVKNKTYTTGENDYGYWRKNQLFPQYAWYDSEISWYAGGLSAFEDYFESLKSYLKH